MGEGGWTMSADWKYNNWAGECSEDTKYDGYKCTNAVSVRSVEFTNYSPDSLDYATLWVLPYDKELIDAKTESELLTYEATESNYGQIPFRGEPS